MTRTQSWLLVAAGIAAAILFLALTYYFGAAAMGHPRIKHMILFLALGGLSLLVSWYAYPKSAA
jgi:hypothetical protein